MTNRGTDGPVISRPTPLVSVIVPCFNIERYIGACLESIAAQNYTNLEVVLVDDGSTDGTTRIIEEFAKTREGWRIVTQPNGGLSSARNKGIDASSGEWLVFVDGDDLITEDAIEQLVASAFATGASLICANHFIRSRGRDVAAYTTSGCPSTMSRHDAFESVLYHRWIDVSACAKMYARQVFQDVRFPVGRVYEDTYIFDELLVKVEMVGIVDRPIYHYVVRPESIVNLTWSGRQLQFVEAVEKLVGRAEALYPDLEQAARRRRVHARLSVLRYMEHVTGSDRDRRSEIVSYIREFGGSVLRDRKAPNRDKAGIVLAAVSPRLFFCFWRAYSRLRKDR